ncbi:MAG: heavy metal transport/detoxification protein [Alistipes sp.]|nr:heavy metal transport/detoxification protein [Alistipes sp.]
MKTLIFKTNARCGGCVVKIDASLRRILPAGAWHFDLTSPDRRLTTLTDLPAEEIMQAVQQAGYRAELLEAK